MIGILLIEGLNLFYFLLKSRELIYALFIIHFSFIIVSVLFRNESHWENLSLPIRHAAFLIEPIILFLFLALLPYRGNFSGRKNSWLVILAILYLANTYLIKSVFSIDGFNNGSWLSLGWYIIYFLYGYSFNTTYRGKKTANNIIFVVVIGNITVQLALRVIPFQVDFIPLWKSILAYQLLLYYGLLVFRYLNNVRIISFEKMKEAIEGQKNLSRTIINGIEEDRKKVAHDLHDEIGGNLALLKLQLRKLYLSEEQLAPMIKLLTKTSMSIRSIAYQLMQPYFEETEFKNILSELIRRLNNGEIKFNFQHNDFKNVFSKQQELAIYRIITELLHNTIKHSKANCVDLTIQYLDNSLSVCCEDDGIGFSPAVNYGIGLQSIRSRVEMLNGTITFEKGFIGAKIMLTIPFGEII